MWWIGKGGAGWQALNGEWCGGTNVDLHHKQLCIQPLAMPIINHRMGCDYDQIPPWRMWPNILGLDADFFEVMEFDLQLTEFKTQRTKDIYHVHCAKIIQYI